MSTTLHLAHPSYTALTGVHDLLAAPAHNDKPAALTTGGDGDQSCSVPPLLPRLLPGPATSAVHAGMRRSKPRRRIDKRLIGPPTDFRWGPGVLGGNADARHVLHASTYEEATELLLRWALEGVGDKLGDPSWSTPIKALVRARAREQQARAVAAVVEASARSRVLGEAATLGRSGLHVVNGLPSSIYSATTQAGTAGPGSGATTAGSTNTTVAPLLRAETPAMIAALRPSGLARLGDSPGSRLVNPFDASSSALSPRSAAPNDKTPSGTPRRAAAAADPLKDIANEIAGLPLTASPGASARREQPGLSPVSPVSPSRQAAGASKPVPMTPSRSSSTTKLAVKRTTPTSSRTPTAVSLSPPSPSPLQAAAAAAAAPAIPFRIVKPSLATLEKSMSVALFFEQFYHGLLGAGAHKRHARAAAAAHPGNHILARARRVAELEATFGLPENAALTEADRAEQREALARDESAALRDRRRRIGTSAFDVGRVIGHGAFGVVRIAREKQTGRLVAMKQLRKADMLRKAQEGHVRAEKDVLAAAASQAMSPSSPSSSSSSPSWIVQLYYAFQDRDHLYLVLEYMGGGDLLNLLVERDTFSEAMTRFYMAEMVLALEQTHALGYIHRDIKPDNFLFAPDGHIRVSDFGLATDLHWAHDTGYYEVQRRELLRRHGVHLEEPSGGGRTRRMKRADVERIMGKDWDAAAGHAQHGGVLGWRDKHRRRLAFSVCGTNSYMAPEVIRGHGYGFSCDWWSLGIIMYEALYGYPPFSSSSRHITRQKILDWKHTLRFPPKPRLSRDCVDLMLRLLCEPEDRIGSSAAGSSVGGGTLRGSVRSLFALGGGDGADDIKAHPWFAGVDWANLHKARPPYQPELRADDDTRHFDDDIPAEPLAPAGGAGAAAADGTKDPLLADKVHGADLLEIRKSLAFMGWTFKAPVAGSHETRYGHLAHIASALAAADAAAALGDPDDVENLDHLQDMTPGDEDERTLSTLADVGVAGMGTVRTRALSL